MGIFDNLPYTNFHELNLDWIIEELTKIREEWDAYREETNAELSEFRTWFDNLDVSDEVRTVVNDMVESGEFLTITTPTITSVTESWLIQHITQETGYVIDDTLTVAGAAADARQVGLLSIEDYKRDDEEPVDISNYFVSNSFINITGSGYTIVDNPNYIYYKIPADDFYVIKVTGYTGTSIKPLAFIDANDNLISYYPEESIPSPGDQVTLIKTTPVNAAYILLSGQSSRGVSLSKIGFNFVKDIDYVGSEDNNNYVLGNSTYKNVIKLNGSQNGLLNFERINYNDSLFKNAGDDISPIYLSTIGYVAGNHGYYWVYNCVSNNHSLAENDIGYTYTTNNITWILLKIVSANNFIIGAYDSSVWWKLKRETPPSAVTFNNKNVNIASSTMAQLYPSVKNGNVELITNNGDACDISEKYTLIDIGTGIEYVKNHPGNCDNNTIVNNSDDLIYINNLYRFDNNGSCAIYQTIAAAKNTNIGFYSGTQSQAFGTNDTISVADTIYDDVTPITGSLSFTKTNWRGSTAPKLYLQYDNNSTLFTKAMAILYIVDRTNDIYTTAGEVNGSSKKLYPYLTQPQGQTSLGTCYNNITCRIPVAIENDVNINYCTLSNDKTVAIIINKTPGLKTISIDNRYYGKEAMEIAAYNCQLKNNIIANTIEIISSGFSYIAIEIS